MPAYSEEPDDRYAFTQGFDRFYTRVAPAYDGLVKAFPAWRRWLHHALPHVQGPRVLEISPGTGYLMTQYAGGVEAYGIDLNERMVATARANLQRAGLDASLCRGTVESLPFVDEIFDTVLCTMAFSGYPDARRALAEMLRVLGHGGRVVIVDVNYPADGNRIGSWLTGLWKRAGDLVRDMDALFGEFGLRYVEDEVGGFGSIHLYVATRPAARLDSRREIGDDDGAEGHDRP